MALTQDDGNAGSLLTALERLAGSGSRHLPEVLERIGDPAHATSSLLLAALTEAGSGRGKALRRRHLGDVARSTTLPLTCQEYATVLGEDPLFHLEIPCALPASGWAERHLQALRRRSGAREAARRLMEDLHSVASEADGYIRKFEAMRRRLDPSIRILDLQALMRAEAAAGSLRGLRVLEIGCGPGGLLRRLRARGARATGIDLFPGSDDPAVVKGDFMSADLPGPYDLIIAVAVFEAGASPRGVPRAAALLDRLRNLTVRGGIVVIENVGFPVPLTRARAESWGFDVVPQQIPSASGVHGGRGCTLRLRR